MFKALLTEKDDEGKVASQITELSEDQLPSDGEVTIAVEYSTLNYKDGLCLNGLGGLVRNYPHIAGIDFAGSVIESHDQRYKEGDKVVLTGWRVGEVWWGGYAQKAKVKADWLVPLPNGLTTRQAMIVGTAGLTAMLALQALEQRELTPSSGEVLVSGASGGVGSVAVNLLSNLGYEIAAITGRMENKEYLESLGATTVIHRDEFPKPEKPLEKERWAGVIDSVGGDMMAKFLTQLKYGASVAAVGLAGGNQLNTTVIPFLLRGNNILGIDSVMQPYESRELAWQRIYSDLNIAKLEDLAYDAKLEDLPQLGKDIIKGQTRGRAIIDMNATS